MDTVNPFDRPDADVILRSQDNVDFHTFKILLSLSSPLFNTMFSMPQAQHEGGDQEFKDGLPVIRTRLRRVISCGWYHCVGRLASTHELESLYIVTAWDRSWHR
jgi:hypothetical protein